MKRARKWSDDTRAGEGHAGGPGGPLRRRKALRHLDSLALDAGRESSPEAAVAHVRVIGEAQGVPLSPRPVLRPAPARTSVMEDAAAPGAPDRHGHPVRAVPIDQPLREPTRSVGPER